MSRKSGGGTLLPSLLAGVLLTLSLAGCGPQERTGNEMRSEGTGERDQRLGNDPEQQNTGRGSVPAEEID